MIKTEDDFKNYYKKWIKAIADDPRTTEEVIIEHLQKHANEAIVSMEEWIASFENLLEILKIKTYNKSDNTKTKIMRLHEKYESDVDKYTGPPE